MSCSSVFAGNDCENQKLYFYEWAAEKSVFVSNILCEYGKTQVIQNSTGTFPKKWGLVYYDGERNNFTQPKKSDIKTFILTLQNTLKNLKKNYSLRESFLLEFIKNPQNFQNIAFQMLEQFVFSSYDKKIIQNVRDLSYIDRELFENTFWDRLLMWGKIISREEWWADENIAKPEVFNAGCEDGNCYWWPRPTSELRQNYIQNFQLIDETLKKEISYTDWRISHKYYPVDRIIIHHTASKYVATKEEWMRYMRSLQRYHGATLRWSDIGYHYLIDGEGNIYEGRAGGKYVLWAHVSTHNYGTIWISLMSDGYYSAEMLASLRQLSLYLAKEYWLDLSKNQNVRNQNLSWVESGSVLIAHKEIEPGKPIDPDIDMTLFRQSLRNYVLLEKYLQPQQKE